MTVAAGKRLVLTAAGAVLSWGVVSSIAQDKPTTVPAAPTTARFGSQQGQPAGMIVTSGASKDSLRIESSRIVENGQKLLLHGLSINYRNGSMYNAQTYDDGRLVAQTDYWPGSGLSLRYLMIDGDGNGHVTVSNYANPREDTTGMLKAFKPADGKFLEVHPIPGTYGQTKLAWVEYKDGKVAATTPAKFEDLGIPADMIAAHAKDPGSVPQPWRDCFDRFSHNWAQLLQDITQKRPAS